MIMSLKPCWLIASCRRLAALIGLSLAASSPLVAAQQFSESQVWAAGESGYASHFVYGICVTWNGTIIVGTEGRASATGDGGDKDLIIKRSTDGGATWGSNQIIEGAGNANGWGQPVFVVDGVTTYLFYDGVYDSTGHHLFFRTSTDNGATWSSRTDITSLWSGNSHGWLLAGPIGHGIKKLKGAFKDTLYIAVHHRTANTTVPEDARYGVDVICKDPDLSGWAIAGETPMSLARGPNEPAIAERGNGDLFIIARNRWDSVANPHSRTAGGGDGNSWGSWVNTTSGGLVGTAAVSGGLLRFSDNTHLFSYPNNPGSPTRLNMGVAVSTDGGVNWGSPRLIYSGASTYSDLARDSLGNIYCLYGRGGTNNNAGGSVHVAKFNLEWATSGTGKATLLIDNTDAGFTTTGTWNTSSSVGGFVGINYRWSPVSTATARWTPTIAAAGNYEVYMRWTSDPNRPNAAPIAVKYNGGSNTSNLTINQQKEGGSWQLVGVFNFTTGTGNYVEIAASNAGSTIADAVMFQQQ
jgi:BNR repeat-like domain